MPTPSRALTNDYNDCKLIKLDSNDPKSPLVVMQEGYMPSDPTCRMRMFYLQRDGFWIDEIARSTRPDTESGDVVFETSAEARWSETWDRAAVTGRKCHNATNQGFTGIHG